MQAAYLLLSSTTHLADIPSLYIFSILTNEIELFNGAVSVAVHSLYCKNERKPNSTFSILYILLEQSLHIRQINLSY